MVVSVIRLTPDYSLIDRKAAFIFLKVIFATGVLSIPSSMVTLGAVPGAIMIVAWGAINTYTASPIHSCFRALLISTGGRARSVPREARRLPHRRRHGAPRLGRLVP